MLLMIGDSAFQIGAPGLLDDNFVQFLTEFSVTPKITRIISQFNSSTS
jgi:hypothetical protein